MASTQQAGEQSTGQPETSDQERQHQIACRAYELYLERGDQSDALQNWLDAETEVAGISDRASSDRARAATTGAEGEARRGAPTKQS